MAHPFRDQKNNVTKDKVTHNWKLESWNARTLGDSWSTEAQAASVTGKVMQQLNLGKQVFTVKNSIAVTLVQLPIFYQYLSTTADLHQ